jgi:cytochrome c
MRGFSRLAMAATITVAAITAVQAAKADDAIPDLFRKNGCMACHAIDHKILGPSYKDISAKYQGNKDALALLMKKIKEGGSGVWGTTKMQPHPNISDTDLKTMVTWILAR